jgi:hypothetical protein
MSNNNSENTRLTILVIGISFVLLFCFGSFYIYILYEKDREDVKKRRETIENINIVPNRD